jgi:TRAP-type C4-dicarboxylate transport system permease small subunit
MRRIVLLILLVLLFAAVLFFVVFLGLNWNTDFSLKRGFGSEDAQVPVIAWTLGAFVAGGLCTTVIFAVSRLRRGRKIKEQTAEGKQKEHAE